MTNEGKTFVVALQVGLPHRSQDHLVPMLCQPSCGKDRLRHRQDLEIDLRQKSLAQVKVDSAELPCSLHHRACSRSDPAGDLLS